MLTPPRIRARAGQGDDGKWYFEVGLWTLDGETQVGDEPMGTFGPWESEAECRREMRRACELACNAIEESVTGKASGKFIDMNQNGKLRSWNEN